MKRLINLLMMLCFASAVMAQQKPVYPRSQTKQVVSDVATWSREFMGIPSGPTPYLPSYVPDSLKCKGILFYKTTAPEKGMHIYDCATNSWPMVGGVSKDAVDSIKALLDTGFIKNLPTYGVTPQNGSFNITGAVKSAYTLTGGVSFQNDANPATGGNINAGGIMLYNGSQGSITLNPGAFVTYGPTNNWGIVGDVNGGPITFFSDKGINLASEHVTSAYKPTDSLDIVRLKDLQGIVTQVDTGYIKNQTSTTQPARFNISYGTFKNGLSVSEDEFGGATNIYAGGASYNYISDNANFTISLGPGGYQATIQSPDYLTYYNGLGINPQKDSTFISSVKPIVFNDIGPVRVLRAPTSANDVVRLQDVQNAITGQGTVIASTYLKKAGDVMTGDLKLASASPTDPLSAAPKVYIDNLITGITWKNAVRVKTTGNITLSGLQTIDGVSVSAGNRVLVNNQTNASQNGIYTASSSAWTRPIDADESNEITSSTVAVTAGTNNKNTQWTYIGASEPVVGTDAIAYGQISGAGTYTASNGINLSGNVFTLDQSFARNLFTSSSGLFTINYSTGVVSLNTNLSQYNNDANFITGAGARGAISATGSLSYNPSTGVISYTQPTNVSAFTNDANYQSVSAADAKYLPLTGGLLNGLLGIQSTTEQLRLRYDASNYTSFVEGSTGNLTITPTGTSVQIAKALGVTGNVSANTYSNSTSSNNSLINLNTTGIAFSRNVNDANAAVTINQQQGTGTIVNFQFGGSTVAAVNTGGGYYGAGLYNISSSNNSYVATSSLGTVINRNVADANSALTVNLANASSTGPIVNFQFAGSTVAQVDKTGRYYATGFGNIANSANGFFAFNASGPTLNRNVADANAVFTIQQQNASATGPLQMFANTAGNRSLINLAGEYENLISGNGIILKSPDGTRYRVSVANGGTIQFTAL